jgi:hypothetical protein
MLTAVKPISRKVRWTKYTSRKKELRNARDIVVGETSREEAAGRQT